MKMIFKLVLVFFFIQTIAVSQTVDEIIEKHIQAMGGREKLNNINSTKMIMKIRAQGFEFPNVSYTTKEGSMKNETTIQNMAMIQAYDAKSKSGWFTNPMQGDKKPQKMNEEMVKEMADGDKQESPLMDYKQKGHTVELLGKEDLEGEDVWKIMLTKKSGNITYYYIDAHNFYIWKTDNKVVMKEKEYQTETFFTNYTTVDGITTAFTTENYSNGKVVMQATIEKIEYNQKLDDALFLMPTEEKKEEPKK